MTTTARSKRSGQKRQPYECCRDWGLFDPNDRAKWEWQVVHHFAHSRTTFTLGTLADRARCDEERGADLIHQAEQLGWIWRPATGIWVGQLARRR